LGHPKGNVLGRDGGFQFIRLLIKVGRQVVKGVDRLLVPKQDSHAAPALRFET
jgi:hypothetical protein